MFASEGAAVNCINLRILPGTIVNADEAAGWDSLNARFEMRRINHKEASWREDNRRVANGEQTQRVAHLAMKAKPSVDFSGYRQRHVKAA